MAIVEGMCDHWKCHKNATHTYIYDNYIYHLCSQHYLTEKYEDDNK